MDSTTIHESKRQRRQRERLWTAFMAGAEEGMIEARGYGLTAYERAEAEALADDLYGEPEIVAAAS